MGEGRHRDTEGTPRLLPRRRPRRARHRGLGARRSGVAALLEVVALAAAGGVAALVIRTHVVQSFYIPSGSMERTLHGCEGCSHNDRVIVDKTRYHWRAIRRGDIVVFETRGTPYEAETDDEDVIKRVIGLAGDTVACCDGAGRVTVDGRSLHESYVFEDNSAPFGPVVVPRGRVWLMGDHRSASEDSRAVGAIPTTAIVGKAFVRFWPPTRVGRLH